MFMDKKELREYVTELNKIEEIIKDNEFFPRKRFLFYKKVVFT